MDDDDCLSGRRPPGFPFEKMVAKSCGSLYPEEAAQLEEISSRGREPVREGEEAGMDTEQMESCLPIADTSWEDCD